VVGKPNWETRLKKGFVEKRKSPQTSLSKTLRRPKFSQTTNWVKKRIKKGIGMWN